MRRTSPGPAWLLVAVSILTMAGHPASCNVRNGIGPGRLPITTLDEHTEPAASRPTGRLLVVGDETAVRRVLKRILTHLGHEAREGADGREGIDAYIAAENDGRPFLAVFMDLSMPGAMGGKEATRRLLEHDPSARIVVASGYSEDPVVAHYEQFGFAAALPKPFQVSRLREVLARVPGPDSSR